MTLPPRPSVSDIAALYRAGDVSPVEAAKEALQRIERLDPAINSFVTVTAEHALEQARQAEREMAAGRFRGPLHGIPYAAKDMLDTRGIRTTIGSGTMTSNVPGQDAAVIECLERAGAVLIGKAGLHEWAYGITSDNPHFGPVRNPWDTRRIPGGSSGGSAAAVAAGICPIAIGSDTGGSIRIPAALCGVAGLKPTFGRVSRFGAFPLGHTLDTLGPFGTCVKDTAIAYAAVAGADPRDPVSSREPVLAPELGEVPDLAGTSVGVPDRFFFDGLVGDVEEAARRAVKLLNDLGATVTEVPVPDIELANSLHRLILLAEASSVHRARFETSRQDYGPDVRSLLDQGLFVLASDYLDAQRLRRRFCESFDAVFESVDALVAPAIPIPTARVGQLTIDVGGHPENVRLAVTRNVRAINLTGLPVLTVPCGFHRDQMPIGLQIVGPRFREDRVLRIGHAYEQAAGWHRKLPPMVREDSSGTPSGRPSTL